MTVASSRGKDKATKLAVKLDLKKKKEEFMASLDDALEPFTEMAESVTEVAEDVNDVVS